MPPHGPADWASRRRERQIEEEGRVDLGSGDAAFKG